MDPSQTTTEIVGFLCVTSLARLIGLSWSVILSGILWENSRKYLKSKPDSILAISGDHRHATLSQPSHNQLSPQWHTAICYRTLRWPARVLQWSYESSTASLSDRTSFTCSAQLHAQCFSPCERTKLDHQTPYYWYFDPFRDLFLPFIYAGESEAIRHRENRRARIESSSVGECTVNAAVSLVKRPVLW